MSYEPGTIIYASIGSPNELSDRAVVMSDGMVRIKMLNGKEHAESMKMSDFIIISHADGKNISVTRDAPAPAAQQQDAAPEPYVFGSDPMPPKGSLVRWRLNDDNRITAIILNDGLHHIKAIENGHYNGVKKYFDCFANWKRHIPNFAEGTLTITPPSGPAAQIYDKPEDINPAAHFKNAELVKYLCKRWDVKSRTYIRYTPAQEVQGTLNFIRQNRDSLSKITEEEDIRNPSLRRSISAQLMRNTKWYTKKKSELDAMPEEQKNANIYELCNHYKQKLFLVLPPALVSDSEAVLGVPQNVTQITYHQDKILFRGKLYSTFEEIGIEGTPRFIIHYRKQIINV